MAHWSRSRLSRCQALLRSPAAGDADVARKCRERRLLSVASSRIAGGSSTCLPGPRSPRAGASSCLPQGPECDAWDGEQRAGGRRCALDGDHPGSCPSIPPRTSRTRHAALPDQPNEPDVVSWAPAPCESASRQGRSRRCPTRLTQRRAVPRDDGAIDVEVAAADVLPAASAGQHW